MRAAIGWCETQTSQPILLFTEDPPIYLRFAFVPVAQHAFDGDPPPAAPPLSARPLDTTIADDAALIDRLLSGRTPVSAQCAVAGAPDLARHNIETARGLVLSYVPNLDALIIHEGDEHTLVLVDVVAASIPSMASILAALGAYPRRVTTLFPPDRLDWSGTPRLEDTGLMARGQLPTAMTRPFMLPPTAEF